MVNSLFDTDTESSSSLKDADSSEAESESFPSKPQTNNYQETESAVDAEGLSENENLENLDDKEEIPKRRYGTDFTLSSLKNDSVDKMWNMFCYTIRRVKTLKRFMTENGIEDTREGVRENLDQLLCCLHAFISTEIKPGLSLKRFAEKMEILSTKPDYRAYRLELVKKYKFTDDWKKELFEGNPSEDDNSKPTGNSCGSANLSGNEATHDKETERLLMLKRKELITKQKIMRMQKIQASQKDEH